MNSRERLLTVDHMWWENWNCLCTETFRRGGQGTRPQKVDTKLGPDDSREEEEDKNWPHKLIRGSWA